MSNASCYDTTGLSKMELVCIYLSFSVYLFVPGGGESPALDLTAFFLFLLKGNVNVF